MNGTIVSSSSTLGKNAKLPSFIPIASKLHYSSEVPAPHKIERLWPRKRVLCLC